MQPANAVVNKNLIDPFFMISLAASFEMPKIEYCEYRSK